MKLTARDLRLAKSDHSESEPIKRPYGEILATAKKYRISYVTLGRWCRENPCIPTDVLARRRPMSSKESGRKGGLRRAEMMRRCK